MVPTEIERDNLDTVRRGFAALACGDIHGFGNVFHPNAVWHVAPAGTLKGHYRGRDQIVGFLAHVLQETDGTFQGDLVALAATGDRVMVQHSARATRNGALGEWHSVLVFTLSDGAATSVHHYSIDYPALARFWE